MNMKILLVEDDQELIKQLTSFLESESFSVDTANGQNSALTKLEQEKFDLVLLDINLADGNGFVLCSVIKEQYQLPVIFLSAMGDEYSTVTGLELGADDYIAKPFRPRELISRIKNVLRRRQKTTLMHIGNLKIDTQRAVVWKNDQEVALSALEYKLLLIFLNNRGQIISRDVLLEEIFNLSGEFVEDNTLTVYVKRLREKIEDDAKDPVFLKTIRGLGYRMD
ncbi:MAG TPA: response regulator transcription factor [Clostridiaceae bacterium]|nr:response regulator transcription factor [Clostridiaceae bacterium]